MKAHDILRDTLSKLSGVVHRLEHLDSMLTAVADTAADVRDGITAPVGLEPQAATALHEALLPAQEMLAGTRRQLREARWTIFNLGRFLPDQAFLDWLDSPNGGAVVIENGLTVFEERGA